MSALLARAFVLFAPRAVLTFHRASLTRSSSSISRVCSLSTALTLHDHPELGITHVLSVCPNYPVDAKGSDDSSPPSVQNPRHRCIAVEDSEYEDILSYLPSAVAFIRDALEPSLEGSVGRRGNKHANVSLTEKVELRIGRADDKCNMNTS